LTNLFPKLYFNHSSDTQLVLVLVTVFDYCHRYIYVSFLNVCVIG